eukprot:TRINITY_DN22258_c0_g1_i4.p1 TRINITY_DN22258_c0_g1~~TRINITY_DN22258_c0_g1_i4.p1  ORF type:complete len:213 (-),score=25.73 TRINITY_DN22258_c0_g1_i4:437-985(-)
MVPLDWSPAMRLETYANMCAHISSTGKVRAVGVCNFSLRQLKELLDFCKERRLPRPAVVQNECHPYLTAEPVRKYCQEQGIIFQAYASLGAGMVKLMEDQNIVQIADSYDVTPAQLLLRWGLQHNLALLPKSSKAARQKSNLEIFDFKLSQEDMKALDSLHQGEENQNTMVGWLREHDPDFY